jgi:hypothetical protein
MAKPLDPAQKHSTMLANPPWYNPGGEQGSVMIDRSAVVGRHARGDQWLTGDLFVSAIRSTGPIPGLVTIAPMNGNR